MKTDADLYAAWLQDVITYKPNTSFTFSASGDRLMMTMTTETWNSRNTNEVAMRQTYTACLDVTPRHWDDEVLGWVRQAVRRFELHEVDEFLTRSGHRINDPHAPGVDPDPQDTTP